MTVKTFNNFTTGPTTVPDVGTCSYNGCLFGPLFMSNVMGTCVQDDAHRTTKLMEYVITLDGYVTLPDGQSSVSPIMQNLRSLLTAHGGQLVYQGRGNDISVNISGSADVAWGPVPRIIEFQPLGGGHSAKVKWEVKVSLYEPQASGGADALGAKAGGPAAPLLQIGGPVIPGKANQFQRKPDPPNVGGGKPGGGGGPGKPGDNPLRMLQFNYESTVSYGEDGFSTLSNKGILEIPLTRSPNQSSRSLKTTADALRGEIERRVMSGIDLTRFRMVRRNFTLSRDKRILTWDFTAEEKPYMDLPAFCSIARGTYTVKPAKAGMGMVTWHCSLRCTYTVMAGVSRRAAWAAFLALLRLRMSQAQLAKDFVDPNAEPPKKRPNILIDAALSIPQFELGNDAIEWLRKWVGAGNKPVDSSIKKKSNNAFLLDFNFEEGMYLDSKTVSFSATWRIVCPFSMILLASGLWTKVDEKGKVLWASTLAQVSGAQSWLSNTARPDVIVDLGGG